MTVHVDIDCGKFIFQRLDDGIDSLSALRICEMQPVMLCHLHDNQLVSAHYHCSKNLTFSIRRSPGLMTSVI